LKKCRDDEAEAARKRVSLETEITGLNKQIDFLKENNNNIINQLKDLSVISSSQAQSIQ
jgi:chemotaxis protein MotB